MKPFYCPTDLQTYRNWRSTRESHSGRLEKRSGFQGRFLVYAGRAPQKWCKLPACDRPTRKVASRGEWRPHQDSNLEPRPLEAAHAKRSVTPCGQVLGKWSSTPVTLRVSLGPKPSGFLSSSCPKKSGASRWLARVQSSRLHHFQIVAVAMGAAPAVSCLTSKRVCCFSSRPEMVRCHGIAPCRSMTPALQTGSRLWRSTTALKWMQGPELHRHSVRMRHT